MQPHSTSSDAGLPYALPSELALVGKYVSSRAHLLVLPALNTHELAWAAGFFDGEGCTVLGHHGLRRFPVPCTDVGQVHPYVLERFRAAVGGIGSLRLRPIRRGDRIRLPLWTYQTRNWRDTQAVLSVMWPFLSPVKREQAAHVFAAYQECVRATPMLGRPNTHAAWSATACPLGHTDIYVRVTERGRTFRRCRVCRRDGTQMPYRDDKGRVEQATGERNGAAKLTAAVVRAMRAQHTQGRKQVEIAREFGLSAQLVNDIVRRKTWRHLAD